MPKATAFITGGERNLQSTMYVPSEPSGAAALFVHGYGANRTNCRQYAKKLTRFGITSLIFDLGGHGESDGRREELSVNNNLADTTQAYDHLAVQESVVPERIGVVGMSYGGYLASLLSAKRPISGLLLRAPPLYPEWLGDVPRTDYDDETALNAEPESDNPALTALNHFAGHVTLVVMEHDQVVGKPITDAYAEALQHGETKLVPDAGHALTSQTQGLFTEYLSEWAQRL